MFIKSKVLIFLFLIGLSVITSAHAGEDYKQLIIGKWGNSDDGGQTFWGFDEYYSDGAIISTGIDSLTYEEWSIKSTYKITDNESCFTVVETTSPKSIPVGYKGCDEIVSIDDEQFKFKDNDKITTLYRVDNSAKLIGEVPKDKSDDIEKLLKISGAFDAMQSLMGDLGAQIASNLSRSKPDIPNRVLEKVENEINNTVQQEVRKNGGLTLRLIRIYHKYYTHNEIKEIIAFYKTPLGDKLAKNTIRITEESTLIGTSWAEKIQPVIIDRMLTVLQSEGYDFK